MFFTNLSFMDYLILFVFSHWLADFALQNDFIAQAKNRHTELGKLYWKHLLLAHAGIHAGFIYLFSGSIVLFFLELIVHFVTDLLKNEKLISFNTDQFIHLLSKLVWILILYF